MDQQIPYHLKRSKRAKHIRLAVHPDGRVVVTSPFGVALSLIEKFLSAKKNWLISKIQFFKNLDHKPLRTFSRKDYLENKTKALELVHERLKFYNTVYGFSFNKVFIKNQKTRWGSCSSRKNLNLNYKIVFLPEEYRDYIIVHELCHLREFNHSKRFWALVEKTIPDYLEIRKKLRKNELLFK